MSDPSTYWQQPAAGAPVAPSAPAPQVGYPVAVQQPKKSHHGWIVALVALVVLALTVTSISSCTSAMMGTTAVSYSPDTVAIIDVSGTIQYDNTACSPEGLKYLLDEAADDDNIKAVVLRVDSGGGTATAGEEMAGYIRDFSKPIVVSSASVNASAAYMLSSQADAIYVAHTTEIGAIGTVLQVSDYSGLMDMLGINVDNIASTESKDSSYGTRPLTEEERAYYQDLVNQINEHFISIVAEGRNMSVDEVRTLATGLVFTGDTAVKNGLADNVGTLEDACAKAADLAGISGDDFNTDYMQSLSSSDLLSLMGLLGMNAGQQQSSFTTEQIKEALKELTSNETVAR